MACSGVGSRKGGRASWGGGAFSSGTSRGIAVLSGLIFWGVVFFRTGFSRKTGEFFFAT
jgi:hypothetical protein